MAVKKYKTHSKDKGSIILEGTFQKFEEEKCIRIQE